MASFPTSGELQTLSAASPEPTTKTERGDDETTGTFRFRNQFFNFIGDTIGGRPMGSGVLRLDNGVTIQGTFTEGGEINGIGTKRWPDGSLLHTTFVNGEPNGHGRHFNVTTLQDYEGLYSKGFRCGYGVLTDHKRSTVFKGFFVRDMPEGKGILTSLSGKCFSPLEIKGYWHRGALQGPALCTFDNGDTMIGSARLGLWEGDGKFGVTASSSNTHSYQQQASPIVYHGAFEGGKRGGVPNILQVTQFISRKLKLAVPMKPASNELPPPPKGASKEARAEAAAAASLRRSAAVPPTRREQILAGIQELPLDSALSQGKAWGLVSQGESIRIGVALATKTSSTISIEIPPTAEEVRAFQTKNKPKKGGGPFVQIQPPSDRVDTIQYGARILTSESGRVVSARLLRVEEYLQKGMTPAELIAQASAGVPTLSTAKLVGSSITSSIREINISQNAMSMGASIGTTNPNNTSTTTTVFRKSEPEGIKEFNEEDDDSVSGADGLGTITPRSVVTPTHIQPTKGRVAAAQRPLHSESELLVELLNHLQSLPPKRPEANVPSLFFPAPILDQQGLPSGVTAVEFGTGSTPRADLLLKFPAPQNSRSPTSNTLLSAPLTGRLGSTYNSTSNQQMMMMMSLGTASGRGSPTNGASPRVQVPSKDPSFLETSPPFPTTPTLTSSFENGRTSLECFLYRTGRYVIEITVVGTLRLEPGGGPKTETHIDLRRFIPVAVQEAKAPEVHSSDEEEDGELEEDDDRSIDPFM